MKKILLIAALFTAFSAIAWTKRPPAPPPTPTQASVLGTTTQDIQFMVNVPAVFKKDLTAPNVIYSLKPGAGIGISDSQTPTVTNTGVTSLQSKTGALTLEAGSGITIDGLKISNSGITSLSAGTGISVSGSTITNTGITSLSAGTGISVDGNKITNTQAVPDYTLSGWTKTGTTVGLTTLTDAVVMGAATLGTATITNGKSITPAADLGADLGTQALRFDKLYVANINSNSSQNFSGQTTFSYPPTDTTINKAVVLINPTSAVANGQLIGFGINGYERALIDEDGDLILGYNNLTSPPVTDNPLTVYGHNGTNVAYLDTSGNLTMGNTITPSGTLTIAGAVNTSGLNVNSGVLYVNASKVGVGTTDVGSQILTVNGGLDTSSLYVTSLVDRSATGTGFAFSGSTITFNNNSSPTMTITSSGVGIGTADPGAYKLNVNGTVNVSGAATLASLNVTGATTLAGLTTTSDATVSGNLAVSGSTNYMTGKLGIGTAAPSVSLDIAATYNSDAIRFTSGASTVLGISTQNNGVVMNLASSDPSNLLSNGTFESDTSSWSGTQAYSLDDEFSDTAPATLATTSPITIASGGVSNPNPTIGSDVITNGGFDTDTDWSKGDGWSIASAVATKAISDTNSTLSESSKLTTGTWYRVDWTLERTTGTFWAQVGSSTNALLNPRTQSGTFVDTNRADAATAGVRAHANASGYVDSVSFKPLTLSTLFSTVSTSFSSDITVSADTTLTAGTQAGVVMNLDSASTPANFVIAYHDGTNIRLDKNVGGTYTNLISTAVTYVPGATIKIARTGNSYSLYYGGVQKGTTQTITDAGIVGNTIHGVFSTYASNSFANFSVQNVISNPMPTAGTEMWDAPAATFTSGIYAWAKAGNNTVENDSNTLKVTYVDDTNGVYAYLMNAADLSSDLTVGQWYSFAADSKVNAGNNAIIAAYPGSGSYVNGPVITNTDFQSFTSTLRATSTTGARIRLGSLSAGEIAWIDNTSLKPLTLSSLFSTVTVASSTDHTVQADVTVTAGTQAGVVLNMDSSSTPTKFVIGYTNGSQACLDKNVSGTYSAVIACTSITYVAGQTLKVIQNGTSYSLFYNGVQVGTTQTISDVPSSTIHGVFSTYASNSFANFSVKGGVNGTLATDGVNTRTVVDTLGKLSVGSGMANFTPNTAWGNPGIWYDSLNRGAGKLLVSKVNTESLKELMVGFDTNRTSILNENALYIENNIIDSYTNTVTVALGSVSGATDYQLATVLRTSGAYHFIRGGAFSNWTFLNMTSNLNTTTLYPGITSYNGSSTSDYLRIPTTTFLPTPLAYDTFTRGDGAIGTSETTGPDSQTTPALSWTGGAISGNTNVITPTIGDELITNGNMSSDEPPGTAWTRGTDWTVSGGTASHLAGTTSLITQPVITVGSWYQLTWDFVSGTGGQPYLGDTSAPTKTSPGTYLYTNRAAVINAGIRSNSAYSVTADNVSVKPLTLSSLFSSVSTSDKDVIASADVTLTAGTQAGLVTNLDSTSSPANFLIAYHDGTNMHLDKNVGGTYTSLINTATTYSAGATLRVITYHSDANTMKVRVYYNNALVGTEQTLTTAGGDTNVMNGTKHGLFSTYSGNSFDNFTLFARGSDGEYADLPAEDLTVTRDTSIKRFGTGSAKLVAAGNNANFVQSINVGNTNTYTVTAYAYTTGAAVTTADLDLWYDTASASATYSDVGGGWYRLQGTVTGAASSKQYGVRVKAGKTVYLDNFSVTSGTATASTMYLTNSSSGTNNLNVQGLIDATVGGVATWSKAGTVSDSDFTGPVNGLLAVDTTNHRLYFREGGAWSYIAKTGGFQIPVEEAGSFNVGDLIIPYVESRMQDGALHGLYTKFSDLVTGGTATVAEYTDHVDVTFGKSFAQVPFVSISLTNTPDNNVFINEGSRAAVKNLTKDGFSIYLPGNALRDYTYTWNATAL